MKVSSSLFLIVCIACLSCQRNELIDDYDSYENSANPDYIIPTHCSNGIYNPELKETNVDCGEVCRADCEPIIACAPSHTLIINGTESFEMSVGKPRIASTSSNSYYLPDYTFKFVNDSSSYFRADFYWTKGGLMNRYYTVGFYTGGQDIYEASLNLVFQGTSYSAIAGEGFNVSEVDGKRVLDMCSCEFRANNGSGISLQVSGRVQFAS